MSRYANERCYRLKKVSNRASISYEKITDLVAHILLNISKLFLPYTKGFCTLRKSLELFGVFPTNTYECLIADASKTKLGIGRIKKHQQRLMLTV